MNDEIIKCQLEDLVIGDIVVVEHASTWEKNRGWSKFYTIKYYLISIHKNDNEYHLQRVDIEHEHFLLSEKRNDSGSVKFVGRYLRLDEVRLMKLDNIFEDVN